ncbi:MAG: hypothetical protein U9N40_05140 [Euryarchaeota archaeon]|nr:hypothetical protein [Euryarchaeota archaeon]
MHQCQVTPQVSGIPLNNREETTIPDLSVSLSEVLPDDPDMRKYIDRITKATSAIERQITFTRDYEHLGVDPSGWQRVADTAERAAFGYADRGVNIAVGTGTLEIFADPMLEKVFYNLFDNGIRHQAR